MVDPYCTEKASLSPVDFCRASAYVALTAVAMISGSSISKPHFCRDSGPIFVVLVLRVVSVE